MTCREIVSKATLALSALVIAGLMAGCQTVSGVLYSASSEQPQAASQTPLSVTTSTPTETPGASRWKPTTPSVPTATDRPRPTEAPTQTRTLSPTPSPTKAPTATATGTPTETVSPTDTPWPTVTARPTETSAPLFVLLNDEKALSYYVWPTTMPTPTPAAIPAALRGRIAFKSDLFDWERILLVNPDGSELALLVDRWAYAAAQGREWYSPERRFRVYQAQGRRGLDLFMLSASGDRSYQLTFVGQGVTYDPAWSPDGLHIAFASNQEGDDDIFVVDLGSLAYPKPRTEKLIRDNGWESDKRPSYSRDGKQIVFSSNRTGRRQLWIVDADGTNLRQLLQIDADCWDPVWLR